MTESKLLTIAELPDWRRNVANWGKRLVVTNGCFDIIHAGHVAYLRAARAAGDLLLVGLNSDSSVRQLKGNSRPINCESDRVTVLSEFISVDAVVVFEDVRATAFLMAAQPDVWVKGGDYSRETIDAWERSVLEAAGAEMRFVPLLAGRSTSRIITAA